MVTTDAFASVSINQVAQKLHRVSLYVVKTIETTGELKLLTWTKLHLKTWT